MFGLVCQLREYYSRNLVHWVGYTLAAHDETDKVFVVNIAVVVLLAGQQLLHLVVGQLLAKGGEQMTKFGRRNVATAILVEMAQALDKVLGSVRRLLLRDRLQDGQEHLETDALI